MSALLNYSLLVDSIFGTGTATFSTTATHTNNVIGALNHPTDFDTFKANFIARLRRLKTIYNSHPTYLSDILVQVNEIASAKNWEGAFAELATYDHFNQDILGARTFIHTPIQPNITLPNTDSYAAECGKSATNLDGYVDDRPLYFDVKCFKDNVTEILEGIYSDLKRHLNTNDVSITAEHELDISYDDFQGNRIALLNELKAGISATEKTQYFKSTVIPCLSYRFLWGAGISSVIRTYHPFRHAENFHRTIFNYASKFIKKNPSIIVLVVFPWYNQVVKNFSNADVELFRALSRRVFCQYKYSNELFSVFNSKFKGAETIYQISNYLSGIVFLVDDTILSEHPSKTNVNSYVYLNPNAVNSIPKSLASDFLMSLGNSAYDDFQYDNY